MAFSNYEDVFRVINLTEEKLAIEGITANNISGHLESAEAEIESYLNTKFSIQQNEILYLDGKGTQYLMLPKHPIANISEIAVDWSNNGTFNPLTSTRFGWKNNGMIFLRRNAITKESMGTWPYGIKNVKVTFDWGYSNAPKIIQELSATLAGIKVMVALSGGKYNSFNSYSLGKLSTSMTPEFIGKNIERLNAEKERLIASYGKPIKAIVNA